MKYYQLFIDTANSVEVYHSITNTLGLKPTETLNERALSNQYSSWLYMVTESETGPSYDFINSFLDILEPHLADLEKLGITKDKILFWMLYEYEHQCSMMLRPQEMARLGQSGIPLNIDCWSKTKEKSTTA